MPASARRHPLRSVAELTPRFREELERFFLDVVFFENKAPSLLGWGDGGRGLAARAWKPGRRRRVT